jgi:hypothetical protein
MTSPRSPGSLALALVLALAGSIGAQTARGKAKPTPAPVSAALEVARVGFIDGGVEVQHPGGAWTKAQENQPLLIGDRVRTLKGGTASLEFPWTAVSLGDGSEISLPGGRVLTLQLERGRVDVDPEQTLIRIVTEEAVISGSGRTLVRREGTATFVASVNGGAEVEASGSVVRLGLSKGTLVTTGKAPGEPESLGPPPRIVSPKADPRYIRPGQDVRLTWTGEESAYHLEILSMDSDVPVMSLDVENREFDIRLAWLGTFRWRVAGRFGPVESQASGEGLICVVEK